jgi:hypothetical protein
VQFTPSNVPGETYSLRFGYDANWFRNSVTDARGNTTLTCYDVDFTGAAIPGSRGNLTRIIAPPPTGGGNPLVKYDSKNNVIERIAPQGVGSGGGGDVLDESERGSQLPVRNRLQLRRHPGH